MNILFMLHKLNVLFFLKSPKYSCSIYNIEAVHVLDRIRHSCIFHLIELLI